jgi:hypothetical protein
MWFWWHRYDLPVAKLSFRSRMQERRSRFTVNPSPFLAVPDLKLRKVYSFVATHQPDLDNSANLKTFMVPFSLALVNIHMAAIAASLPRIGAPTMALAPWATDILKGPCRDRALPAPNRNVFPSLISSCRWGFLFIHTVK